MANTWNVVSQSPVEENLVGVAPEITVTPTSQWNVVKEEPAQPETNIVKGVGGEALAAVNLIAETPQFIGSAINTFLDATYQGFESSLKGTPRIDWGKARENANSSVRMLNFEDEFKGFADAIGLGSEYENSKINQGLQTLGEKIDWVAEKGETKFGIPKEGTKLVIDTAMIIGIPGVGKVKDVVYDKLTTPSAKEQIKYETTTKADLGYTSQWKVDPKKTASEQLNKEIVGELTIPKSATSSKELADSLYTLTDIKKADETIVARLEKEFNKLGINPALKEKFRRYTEQTALGNEQISSSIRQLEKEIKGVHQENAAYFQDSNLRSAVNPNGTTLWKDFGFKKEVLDNKKRIDNLNLEIEKEKQKYKQREELTLEEQQMYNQTVGPQLAKITDLNRYLHDEGLVPKIELDPTKVGGYAPRYGMPEKKSAWQYIKDKLAGDKYGLNQDFATALLPSAAKERAIFAHEFPDGTRNIVSFKGDSIVKWEKGTPKQYMQRAGEELKAGDKLGRGTLKEATLDEIELNTPYRYSRNLSAVTGTRLTELRDLARVNEWIKQFKNSDYFKEVAHEIKPGVNAPQGFVRPENLEKFPQLNNYVFEPRVAEILSDFNKTWQPNFLTEASNGLVKNMMLNPLPHMHNELVHWFINRGASGILTPKGILQFAETLPKAVMEVMDRGPMFREIMRQGGSVMSANVRNNALLDKAFKENLTLTSKDPKFVEYAKRLGRSPLDLYEGISKFSNKSMWTVRDILYTQLVMETMTKGKVDLPTAIKSVERHMPSYRLPSRVGEKILGAQVSRMTAKVLQNPSFVIFARYKHGMLSSLLNTSKDLLMLDPKVKKSKQFKEGTDAALATAIAIGAVYPLLDSFAQALTGDQDSKVRRAGVLHLFDAVGEISKSKKDPYSLLSAVITFNPTLQALFQLAANYELYNRRNIYNVEDDWDLIATDVGKYLLKTVPQAGETLRATSEFGGGFKQWLAKQFDVKTKTFEQKAREEDQVERRKSAAENRKWGGQ
jgi:hypothetical protein